MAANDKQKIIVLDVTANTQTVIEEKLALGYVILFIVNLQPAFNKLMIVYANPEQI
jgi:hypothetical protein